MNKFLTPISVIVPVFNEEGAVLLVLEGLKKELDELGVTHELIAINDGSTDQSKQAVEKLQYVKLISHPYNKGMGASLKTGVRQAMYDWLLFFDADNQHDPTSIKDLLELVPEYDMVVGSRQGYKGPWIRQPGKKLLTLLASYLVDFKIPDLTSGLRIVNKNLFLKFYHLYPNSFSLYTTITLAFLKDGLSVAYVPIHIHKRIGKSTVSPKHALLTLGLIIRMITLFSPMKIFLPAFLFFSVLALSSLIFDVINFDLTDTTVTLLIFTTLVLFFGIVLDQLSALRIQGQDALHSRK